MSALMIARITVKNAEKFQQYLVWTKPVAANFGAELLFRGKANKTLFGKNKDHDIVVIVRFPSIEKIDEWANSKEYAPLITLREECSEMQMISYEISS